MTEITVQRVEALRAATSRPSEPDPHNPGQLATLAVQLPPHSGLADVLTEPVLNRVQVCAGRGGSAFVKDELVHLIVLLHALLADGRKSSTTAYAELRGHTMTELHTVARLLLYNPVMLSKISSPEIPASLQVTVESSPPPPAVPGPMHVPFSPDRNSHSCAIDVRTAETALAHVLDSARHLLSKLSTQSHATWMQTLDPAEQRFVIGACDLFSARQGDTTQQASRDAYAKEAAHAPASLPTATPTAPPYDGESVKSAYV